MKPSKTNFHRIKYLFFAVLVQGLCSIYPGRAQSIQQLQARLDTSRTDSGRSIIYYTISMRYWNKNVDSVLVMADKGLESARKGQYDNGIALNLLSKGTGYTLKEEYPEALNCLLQALRISERLKGNELTGNLYTDIGIVYADMGDHAKSMEYYLSALRIAEKHGDQHETAILLTNIAETYKDEGAYDSALAYNYRALPIMMKLHDSVVVAAILLNIGDDYNKKGQSQEALRYFSECSVLAKNIHDEVDFTWAGISTAEALLKQRKYIPSIQEANVALGNARRYAFAQIVPECYSVLYSDYRGLRNFEQALEYRNLEVAWKDSVNTLEKEKKIRNLQSGYDLEKKQHQIDMLKKDSQLQQQELAGQRKTHIMFAASALFFGMWAFFLFKSNKEKERLNRQLRMQNREMLRQEDMD